MSIAAAQEILRAGFLAAYPDRRISRTEQRMVAVMISLGASRVAAGEKAEWVTGHSTPMLKFSKPTP